jgi:lipopolysaccharide transport system ATP-binding protein
MSDIALRVENLSKQYKIGATQYRHNALRDQLMDSVKTVFRRNSRHHTGRETFWALKNVTFDVQQGEAIGLIGRNGTGKSTLLKILAHITKPTTGRAEIYGRVGGRISI